MAFKTVASSAKTILDITDSYTTLLSNETITIACDKDGVAISGELGSTGKAKTTIIAYRGSTPLMAVASNPGLGQFSYSISAQTNCTAARVAGNEASFYINTVSADSGSVTVLISLEGDVSVTKILTFAKAKTGSPGKGISSTEITYQAHTNGTTAPTGTWLTNPPVVAENQYLWTKTVITYTDASISTSYSVGKMGDKGRDAALATINPSSLMFKSTDGGATFSPESIILTPAFQGEVAYSNWQYSVDGGTNWITVATQNGLSINSTTKALTISKTSTLFTALITALVFRVNTNDATIYDTVTITKMYDVVDLTQQAVFNKLTNNGLTKGFTLDIANNSLYINASYIQSDNLVGDKFVFNNGYIKAAVIQDLSVTNAKIADATIESAKIVSLAADKIDAATLSAITADVGTLTAGLLKNASGTTYLNLTNGTFALGSALTFNGTDLNITANSIKIGTSAVGLASDITAAASAATTANNALADIASDSKLTAVEKKIAKKEWDVIVAEKAGVEAQATLYSITTEKTTYTNAYSTLNTYITPLLADLSTTSDFVGATFRTNFKNYYDAKQKLLDKVAAEAKGFVTSEINVVNGAINLKVSKNDVINQINVSTEGTQISGNKVDIAASDSFTATVGALEPKITKSTTAPVSPVVGQLWLDTNPTKQVLKRWTGSAWSTEGVERGEFSSLSQTATDLTASFNNQVVGGKNFVLNSNFAKDGANWTLSNATIDSAIGVDDTRSVKMTGALATTKYTQQVIAGSLIPTGTAKLTASCMVKGTSLVKGATNPFVRMYVEVGYTDATTTYWNSPLLTGTFDWKKETILININTAKTINEVRIHGYARDFTGTIWYDNFKLEEGNTPTAWTPHPSEIYAGVTTIDKDGINVAISTSGINTQMSYDGVRIKQGSTDIAVFGEGVSEMSALKVSSLEADTPNYISGGTYTIGPDVGGVSKDFTTVSAALYELTADRRKTIIKNGQVLKFEITGAISDNIVLYNFSGGTIEISFTSGSRLSGRIYAWFCNSKIDIHGASGANGTIKWDGTATALINTYGSKFITVSYMNFDRGAATSSYGVRLDNGSIGYVENCDFGNVHYAVMSYTGSIVSCKNNKGSCVTAGYYTNGGVLNALGTGPNPGVANSGWYNINGTITLTASSYVIPATTPTVLNATFKPVKMETYNRTEGFISTYYGATAVQGKYTGMSGWMEGRITFGTDVANFWQGGTSISVQMRLHRKNSTHGSSSAILPDPDNFSATWSTGAVRGGWSGWATVSTSEFSTTVDKLFTFYSPTLDSGYAIWDDVEVKVTVTKNI